MAFFFLVVGGKNSKDVCSLAYDITHMWNLILKNDTNELLYKTETEVQISKTKLTDNEKKLSPKGKWAEGLDSQRNEPREKGLFSMVLHQISCRVGTLEWASRSARRPL